MGLSIAHISPVPPQPPSALGTGTPARLAAGPENRLLIPGPGAVWGLTAMPEPWVNDESIPVDLSPGLADPYLQVARRAALMKLRGGTSDGHQRGGGLRGQVRGLSRQARGRLLDLVAAIDRSYPASHWLFVTLTYPAEYPNDPTVYHSHLDSWLKRLGRKHPGASAIWKLEYQRRGAPHYHLLLFGRTWLDIRWVSESWYQIVGSNDPAHLRVGTQVKRVETWNGVTWYASKYCAKTDPRDQVLPTGRVWGVHNRKALPVEILALPLLWPEFHQLRRLMRRWSRGAKPLPWCRGPPGGPRRYLPRSRARGQGMKLFVAETVCYRLLRGVGDLAQTY